MMDSSSIFHKLQPLCVNIAQKPCLGKITDLHNYIVTCTSAGNCNLTPLLEYIIFPLHITMKRQNIPMGVKLSAIDCICALLLRTTLDRFDIFQEVFRNVCLMLSSDEPGKVRGIAEEAKEGLIDCIIALLKSATQDVLQGIYSKQFLPSVGHCISLLLCVAENEKGKHLVVKAVKCIESFVTVFEQGEDELIHLFHQRQKILSIHLASFLPGISISLSKIIMGGISQGHNVIIGALRAWMAHIQVVLNDKYLPGDNAAVHSVEEVIHLMSELTTKSSSKCEPENTNSTRNPHSDNNLLIQKDTKWYSNTSSKLKILIERLPSLVGNPSWKVHLVLLEFSEVLIKNCSKSLEACMPVLVELVVGFSSHDYTQVAGKSQDILNELQMLLGYGDHGSFIQVIEERLYGYLTSIPREMRSTEEQNKLHILHVILGYLHLLGSHLTAILSSSHFLKRISQALIQITEFDLSDIKIVEEKSSYMTKLQREDEKYLQDTAENDDLTTPGSATYKKRFKHFRGEKMLNAICRICRYLGSSDQLVVLVDHFLEVFRSSPASRKETAFLMNEIIRGTIEEHNPQSKGFSIERLDNLQTCITLILNEYLSPDVWKNTVANDAEVLTTNTQKHDIFLITSERTSESKRLLPFSELNSNIQLSCLLLEGLGVFASALREHFDDMLLEVLYPLMEKLGSSNATVSQMAYFALVTISASCRYGSVEDLVKRNVDYLINSISLNLRHMSLHPDTPAVFSVMLQCGNKELIPYLPDCLDEVLDRIDYATDRFLLSLAKCLNAVARAISAWFPGAKYTGDCTGSAKQRPEHSSVTDLKEYFMEYLKLKQESLGEVLDEEFEPDEKQPELDVDEEEKPDKKEIAQHIKFTEQVLGKCTHFLTSKFVEIRLIMLDTTEQGVITLAGEQDHLLPMIHKLWLPMVQCFTDHELMVRTKAVSVLGTMVSNTGQFMRRRVIKDALPSFTSFLTKQQVVSEKAAPVYHHTQGFKLQLIVLKTVGALCRNLDISDVELDNVMSSVTPYLSQRQPSQLQQAAVKCMKELMDLEPDHVWLSLNDLYCPNIPSLPSPEYLAGIFLAPQFACGSSNVNQYTNNVKLLLED